ncbi:glutathione binding-like protein [Trinickia sp. NRRL B-1857]|uniref:glutathione binding-like protein n=1 Tax=Trinickia sp. NRRL B-1857 TaxID=3162879 RepID=UPI003D2C0221
MDLYFSPMACSLATRIAFYEAGYEAQYIQVDTKRKQLQDGSDFFAINPLGQVPVLRTDDGSLLFENSAILPYVADRFPAAKLAPVDGLERARLHQWLGFIGTELHKALFVPLLDEKANDDVKRYAREHVARRMQMLQAHLAAREWMLERFSIVDIYLAVVLNWARYCDVDLAPWPAALGLMKRVMARPAAARGFEEELALFRAELARQRV